MSRIVRRDSNKRSADLHEYLDPRRERRPENKNPKCEACAGDGWSDTTYSQTHIGREYTYPMACGWCAGEGRASMTGFRSK